MYGGADSYLRIYTGPCAGTQSLVGSNDDSCASGLGNSFASRIAVLNFTSVTTYYIQWRDDYTTSTNAFNWAVIFTPAPSCPNVTALSASAFMAGGNATISWTAATGAVSYNFEIQPVGVAQGTVGAIIANTSTISTTNLVNGSFVSGNLYTLYVRSVCSGGAGAYQTINFAFTAPPANDSCAGLIDLDTLTSPINGTSAGALKDFNQDCLSANAAAPDVVYSITVANSETLSIGQTVNNFDSVVRLAYGGSCPGNTLIVCMDDSDTQVETWENTTGSTQEVYFVILAYQTQSGTFILAYNVTAPLSCGDASGLAKGNFITGGATNSWTPGFNSLIYNYEIQPSATIQGTASAIVANINTSANYVNLSGAFVSGSQYTLHVQSVCGAGNGNYVSSNFTYSITPSNDECANAITLTVNSDLGCGTITAGKNVGASAASQTDDVVGTPDDDVWFSFTATAASHRISLTNVVAVTGSSVNLVIGLYDATSGCAALVKVIDSNPDTYNATGLVSG